MRPSLLKYLLIQSDYELFEALSATTLMLFGMGLLNPTNNNSWGSPAYKYISMLCTQFELAVVLIFFGALGLIALKYGGLKCRLLITLLKTIIWMMLFSLFAVADPPRTISAFILGYVLFNFILLGRQWSDYSLGKLPWNLK